MTQLVLTQPHTRPFLPADQRAIGYFRLFGLTLSALCVAPWVSAQSLPVPVLANPNVELAQAGLVRDVERLGDGSWLIVGNFGRVGGLNRLAGIARLQSDGSVDPLFNPTTSLASTELRRVATGAGGRSYALYTTQALAIQANGSVDPTFTPIRVGSGVASAMAVVSDGILVGGTFTQLLTTPATSVSRLVKFNLDGSFNSTFAVPADFSITAIRNAGPDRVLIVGGFANIGGQARTGVALVDTSGAGAVISTFNPVLVESGGSVFVQDAAVVGDAAFVVGRFGSVNGNPRSRAAKLSLLDGSVDPGWVMNIGGTTLNDLRVEAIQSHVLISSAGNQTYANPPTAATTRLVAKVAQSTGVIDTSFDLNLQFEPGFTPLLAFAEGDAPTRTLAVGSFMQIGTNSRFGVVQVDSTGQQDTLSAHAEAIRTGAVNRLAFEAGSGRTYMSGAFRRAGAAARRFVVRLNAAGVVDSAWRPAVDERSNPALAVAPGVGVFVAGNAGILKFDEVAGDPVPGWTNTTVANDLVVGGDALYSLSGAQLRRFPLSGNGSADPGFSATVSQASALQYDALGNSLLLIRQVSVAGGGTEQRLTRLDALTGAPIAAFDLKLETTNAVVPPQGYTVDGDGVWVAGNFTRVNGATRASPVRIRLADGLADPAVAPTTGATFNNGLNVHRGFFYGLRFLAGGIAEVRRMPASGGSLDPNWILTANTQVHALVGDGIRLQLGGAFDRIGAADTPRLGIAAVLESDGLLANGFE